MRGKGKYFLGVKQVRDQLGRRVELLQVRPRRLTLQQSTGGAKGAQVSAATDEQSWHQLAKLQSHPYPSRFIYKHKPIQKPLVKPAVHIRPHSPRPLSIRRDLVAQLTRCHNQGHCFELIFDWMMEVSALLRVTKNAFYRAMVLLSQLHQLDQRLMLNPRRVVKAVCGALVVAIKFESSNCKAQQLIYWATNRAFTRQEIKTAEHSLLQQLQWQLPVNVGIELQLVQIVKQWNHFLTLCQPLHLQKMLINPRQQLCNKQTTELVYLVDHLTIKMPPHALLAAFRDSWSKVIAMAVFMVASLNAGDVMLRQKHIWHLFEQFSLQQQIVNQREIGQYMSEVMRVFGEQKIIQVLGRIPLRLNYQNLVQRRHQQFYIAKIDPS